VGVMVVVVAHLYPLSPPSCLLVAMVHLSTRPKLQYKKRQNEVMMEFERDCHHLVGMCLLDLR